MNISRIIYVSCQRSIYNFLHFPDEEVLVEEEEEEEEEADVEEIEEERMEEVE